VSRAIPGALVRAALALYPRGVRERYGAEIADLLAHSPAPVRDLADVTWCALTDRGGSLTVSQLRPHLTRLAGLLAAPLLFGLAMVALASVALTGLAALEDSGHLVDVRFVRVLLAATVVPVGAIAVWLARRIGRGGRIAAPGFVVPAALALGIGTVASLPYLGGTLGEARAATLVSSACWCAATAALATGCGALIRRRRTGAAGIALVLGGLTVVDLACAVYLSIAPSSADPHLLSTLGAYPALLVGVGSGPVGDPAGELAETLKGLPQVLTVCTAFALTLTAAVAGRRNGPDTAAND
jgi:hypothetical protein